MNKQHIISSAAAFAKAANLKDDRDWTQEAHSAFVAKTLKTELLNAWGNPEDQVSVADAAQAVAELILEISSHVGSFVTNASAFKQTLASEDVAVLRKTTEAKALGNRYAGMV